MNWTEEQLEAKLKENPHLKIHQGNPSPDLVALLKEKEKQAKPHKYRAKPTYYNGIRFGSQKEAQYAQDTDLEIKAGIIDFYLTQVPFRLPGTIHRLDFVKFKQAANTPLYEVHFVEVKGFETQLGKIKRRQVEELYGIEIEVV